MINIYLFTKKRKIISFFNKIRKARTFSLTIYNPVNYRKILTNDSDYFFAYIDISSFTSSEKRKFLTYITRQRKFDYGILDPENWIVDSASLFHKGASDYLPGPAIIGEISTKRIKDAINFYMIESAESDIGEPDSHSETILLKSSWDIIAEGNSYTFIFMFIEIDMIKDWASHSGKAHINDVMNHFYKHLQNTINPLHGRIWIKTEYGALVLFPYAGSATPIILECFKLVLDKIIISAEEYPYKTILSYKIALDIGTTKYLTKGNTGSIVSDSVNYIFHLGNQYAKAGNFYLTNLIYEDIPSGLLNYFALAGNFQDKTIHRMLLPDFKT